MNACVGWSYHGDACGKENHWGCDVGEVGFHWGRSADAEKATLCATAIVSSTAAEGRGAFADAAGFCCHADGEADSD